MYMRIKPHLFWQLEVQLVVFALKQCCQHDLNICVDCQKILSRQLISFLDPTGLRPAIVYMSDNG